MTQPKLTIAREPLDYFLLGVTAFALLLMLGLIVYYYDLLPERIPTHFNLRGEPDDYGRKSTLWFVFGIAALLLLVLEFFTRRPHWGNYTVPITEGNAARQYRNMQRMTRTLLAVVSLFFAYITFAIIQTALDHRDGLSAWIALLFVVGIIGVIGYFLARAKIMER